MGAGLRCADAVRSSVVTAPRLVWKLELSATEDSERNPADAGPAWIDFPETPTSPKHSEKVRGGEWISRREAHEIAVKNGYELLEDDAGPRVDEFPPEASSLDVAAINSRLRALGVSPEELTFEPLDATHVELRGSLLIRLKEPGSAFSIAVMMAPPEKALDVLDQLVPGWRSNHGEAHAVS